MAEHQLTLQTFQSYKIKADRQMTHQSSKWVFRTVYKPVFWSVQIKKKYIKLKS